MSIKISLSTISKAKRIYVKYPKCEASERIITMLSNDSNRLTRGQCKAIARNIHITLDTLNLI